MELNHTQLKRTVSVDTFDFVTTKDICAYPDIIGQDRAAKSLEFGLNIKKKGYNIYAQGLPGAGKTTFAVQFAKKIAENEKVPPDICYIYNFKNPKEPKLLKLKPGYGKMLCEDMDDLIERLLIELPKAFNSKDMEQKRADALKAHQAVKEEIIKEMTEEAKLQNFGVKTTNSGIYFMPIVDGEIISEEQYDELTSEQKEAISKNSEAIQAGAAEAMRIIKDGEKVAKKEIEDLEYSLGLFEVGRYINELLIKYNEENEVIDYLFLVKEDILDNISDFLEEETEEDAMQMFLPWANRKNEENGFTKYKINVLVDNSELKGSPVIVDFNPTYTNLVGEVEYDNEYGNFITDFLKIKPGILHKANGGYLILQAHDVLTNLLAWETLKRVLKTEKVVTEPIREFTTGIALSGIKPEPVPINIKVIIVGSYFYYDILTEYDDDFKKLFRIKADFDYEMDFNEKNMRELTGFISKYVEKENTLHFHVQAVAKIIEYSIRLAENQEKLTTCFSAIEEILVESETWAKMDNASIITVDYVEKAITQRDYRMNIYEEKLSNMIEKNIIIIDTTGEKVGQINGLAVLETEGYIFAKPSRITATAYVGKAGIVNIEKEAEMSGNIHDKGIQVIIGYLGQTYAQDFPLSLSSRICFEQNYNGIDGDSASSTELYAVLSSLSGFPIKQELANTGSINQFGEIQPIGGVTYKIEGFYDLCNKRGLTGNQGVIIPKQNIKDLVLRDEVIEAVRQKKFHIYAIDHINDGIELLTGVKAGVPNEKGKYPTGTVHATVTKKLKEFYKKSISEE